MRRYLVAALVCFPGCLFTGPDAVPASTPNEVYAIARAHQFAEEMSVWVRPRLTDEVFLTTCSDGSQCPAAGWVPNGGKSHDVYLWRPWVNGAEHPEIDVKVRHEVEHVACQCRLGED